MKDLDQQLIFETYSTHQDRLLKIQYLRENFEDGAGKGDFGGGSDSGDSESKSDSDSESKSDNDSESKSDSDSESKSDSDSDSKSDSDSDSKSGGGSDSKSDSSSSSSSSSSPSKSSGDAKVDKGKMSEEELDVELDALMSKKDKIEKLFKDGSIDEEAAHQALDKIKGITNQLVANFI